MQQEKQSAQASPGVAMINIYLGTTFTFSQQTLKSSFPWNCHMGQTIDMADRSQVLTVPVLNTKLQE